MQDDPTFITPSKDPIELQWEHLRRHGIIDKDSLNPPIVQRKLKKKPTRTLAPEIQVDWTIDLHECTVSEAESEVIDLFNLAQNQTFEKSRIVHGGHMGRYGPVQRTIERLLKGKLRKWVKEFRLDGMNDGATIVWWQWPETKHSNSNFMKHFR
jgi:hypothetical protein